MVIFKSNIPIPKNTRVTDFTFQSGYIQILSENIREGVNMFFTFQSGYIQIPTKKGRTTVKHPLHSNLVLFKSVKL